MEELLFLSVDFFFHQCPVPKQVIALSIGGMVGVKSRGRVPDPMDGVKKTGLAGNQFVDGELPMGWLPEKVAGMIVTD